MVVMTDYSEGELRLMVQQERVQLAKEFNELVLEERRMARRRGEITARLAELDKADNLLEGGMR